jgi:hypothetical protein
VKIDAQAFGVMGSWLNFGGSGEIGVIAVDCSEYSECKQSSSLKRPKRPNSGRP